jgi:hypothetical protein
MLYMREIPMLQKHVQEHGDGIGGVLAGGRDMFSKMLFEPFKELWNNRSYFGSGDLGHQCPQATSRCSGRYGTSSVSSCRRCRVGAQRAQETGGRSIETPLAYLGFGPAPKYAAVSALQNRIGHLYREHVAPGARSYQDEANTHERLVARNNLLLAQQSGNDRSCNHGRTETKFIKETLRGVTSDQRMFKQLPKTDQKYLLNQATPDQRERYLPFAKRETRTQWYTEHPPQ